MMKIVSKGILTLHALLAFLALQKLFFAKNLRLRYHSFKNLGLCTPRHLLSKKSRHEALPQVNTPCEAGTIDFWVASVQQSMQIVLVFVRRVI